MKRITCCPHCGSEDGIYCKVSLIDVIYYIGFDGKPQYNGEMYDSAKEIRYGRIAYCQNCDKSICRMSTMDRQWAEEHNERKES